MTENILKKPEISFWLAIIIPLIGFAIQWGVIGTKVNSCCRRCEANTTKLERHIETATQESRNLDARLAEIQVQLQAIKKDIEYIRKFK